MAVFVCDRVPLFASERVCFQAINAENLVAIRGVEIGVNVQVNAHQVNFKLTPIQLGQPRRVVMDRHNTGRIGRHGVTQGQCLGMNGQVLCQLRLDTTGHRGRDTPSEKSGASSVRPIPRLVFTMVVSLTRVPSDILRKPLIWS